MRLEFAGFFLQMSQIEQEWLQGRMTLGTAAKWTAEEIRLVSELGYALAEQGRNIEAIAIFEGLSALAPATTYFQNALGALFLRENQPERAIYHLSQAISAEPNDLTAYLNRGESYLRLHDYEKAREDLNAVLQKAGISKSSPLNKQSIIRARALLTTTLRLLER